MTTISCKLAARFDFIYCFIFLFLITYFSQATVNYNKILNHLSLDLISLFDSGDFSDIDIVVDGTKIPAHKCILSARSPIFKAMFSYNNTKEALEKEVVIPDVSVNVMKEFLRFIYTGVKPKESPYFLELLTIADMVNSIFY